MGTEEASANANKKREPWERRSDRSWVMVRRHG